MSFWSKISNAEHTFVAWAEKQWAAFMKEAPTIEAFIENAVKYAVGVLKIVLAQMDASSPAGKAITVAMQDLLTLSAVVYDAGAHPSLAGDFQAVVNNLGSLESAFGLKNANLLAIIAKVIGTLGPIVSALLQIVPVAAAAV